MKRAATICAFLILLYTAAYLVFRTQNQEIWAEDGNNYVIFSATAIWVYYAFRPASRLDGILTGMRTHIGPHINPERT